MNQETLIADMPQMDIQAQQDRLLEQRLREAGHDVPAMRKLRSYLLSFGGRSLVYPCTPDEYLPVLMNKGAWMTADVVLRRMMRSQCHRNVAKLWLATPRKLSAIGSGYALSDDGLWRMHSWGIRKDGKVVETTVVRLKYFGLVFEDKEADLFAQWNN